MLGIKYYISYLFCRSDKIPDDNNFREKWLIQLSVQGHNSPWQQEPHCILWNKTTLNAAPRLPGSFLSKIPALRILLPNIQGECSDFS